MDLKIVKFFLKKSKWIISGLIIILLFIFILSIVININKVVDKVARFSDFTALNAVHKGHAVKPVKLNVIYDKYRRKAASRQTGETQVRQNAANPVKSTSPQPSINKPSSLHKVLKPFPLNNLFKLPYNLSDDSKFNSPFISTQGHKTIQGNSYANPVYNPVSKYFPKTYSKSGEHISNFIKNIKFKGFSEEKPPNLSVLFVTNKIALIKIGRKKYYVHSGMDIKGNYILSISLSGLSYSRNGKIKIKHLSVN